MFDVVIIKIILLVFFWDTRVRSDDSALCLRARCVGRISRKLTEIEAPFQRTTNTTWTMANRIVTWSLTSHDHERSRSRPQYVWFPLFQKRLEIDVRFQRTTSRKCPMANWMVTWKITSHDPESRDLNMYWTIISSNLPPIPPIFPKFYQS